MLHKGSNPGGIVVSWSRVYDTLLSFLRKAADFIKKMVEYLLFPKPVHVDLVDQVEEARQKWQTACRFFDSATDPDLVDYAIYSLQAAEHHYIYLLKQARREGCESRQLI